MKTAIITDASSGLGSEYAKQISRKYPQIEKIWLIARRKERLETLAEEIGKDKCLVLPLDLTKEDSFITLSKKLEEINPDVKILVNNAGFGKMGNFEDTDRESSSQQIMLNCVSPIAVTKEVLPFMNEGAEIINIASIAAFAPNPRLCVYSSTKAFVYNFSIGLREELKERKINVLAVCPGPMDTEFLGVANIFSGSSKMFDTLPHIPPSKVVKKSIEKSAKKKAVCTNHLLFKLYRVLSKLLPKTLLVKIAKV